MTPDRRVQHRLRRQSTSPSCRRPASSNNLRQPENAVLEPVAKFEQGGGSVEPIFIDPSRGVILSLLVQSPTLQGSASIRVAPWATCDPGAGIVIGACWPVLRRSSLPHRRCHAQAAGKQADHQAGSPIGEMLGCLPRITGVTTSRIWESKLDRDHPAQRAQAGEGHQPHR